MPNPAASGDAACETIILASERCLVIELRDTTSSTA
ncbi:hypothetical protein JMJ77_0012029 [Colletotrichum scovillei]|uniref:Uncharacterized protein n=1 Tax=Colletotrichum scovillei TaxID=1209932 RepID=A0A9P7UAN0_9PEZI|nr:hypothetical protein JMJ77_0012029 [Colletotrichum scovillei]KAG7046313.1 hypothetical protein JMJ78_0011377 [Colletotrichum scovillei]KAG7063665.1 hypothetical protein JMJ76_0006125 [Colletotrichum scovillei]